MTDIQTTILYTNMLLSLGVILFGFVVAIFYYFNGNKILSILSGLVTVIMIYFTLEFFKIIL